MSLLGREEKLWGVNNGYTLKEYWGGGTHSDQGKWSEVKELGLGQGQKQV